MADLLTSTPMESFSPIKRLACKALRWLIARVFERICSDSSASDEICDRIEIYDRSIQEKHYGLPSLTSLLAESCVLPSKRGNLSARMPRGVADAGVDANQIAPFIDLRPTSGDHFVHVAARPDLRQRQSD